MPSRSSGGTTNVRVSDALKIDGGDMFEVLMPSMPRRVKKEKVRLVAWHKAEGDEVLEGDLLAVIETNKAAIDIEAEYEGTLVKILVAAGTVSIASGTPLAVMEVAAEILEAKAVEVSPPDSVALDVVETPSSEKSQNVSSAALPLASNGDMRGLTSADLYAAATPLAQRIAGQRGINLSTISGSGAYGRIVERDVETVQPAAKVTNEPLPSAPLAVREAETPLASQPGDGLRLIIGDVTIELAADTPAVRIAEIVRALGASS